MRIPSNSKKPRIETPNPKTPGRLYSHIEKRLLWSGILLAVLCICLIAFADPLIARHVNTMNRSVYRFFKMINLLGNSAIYLIPFGMLGILLRVATRLSRFQPLKKSLTKAYYSFFFLFLSITISGIITDILKFFFGRGRPRLLFSENYYGFAFFELSADMLSFPSGHANTAFALAVGLFFLFPKGWFFYFPVAILVGAGRVLTGSHYPSDVIAGAYLAVLTTLYIKQFFIDKNINIFDRPGPLK